MMLLLAVLADSGSTAVAAMPLPLVVFAKSGSTAFAAFLLPLLSVWACHLVTSSLLAVISRSRRVLIFEAHRNERGEVRSRLSRKDSDDFSTAKQKRIARDATEEHA